MSLNETTSGDFSKMVGVNTVLYTNFTTESYYVFGLNSHYTFSLGYSTSPFLSSYLESTHIKLFFILPRFGSSSTVPTSFLPPKGSLSEAEPRRTYQRRELPTSPWCPPVSRYRGRSFNLPGFCIKSSNPTFEKTSREYSRR